MANGHQLAAPPDRVHKRAGRERERTRTAPPEPRSKKCSRLRPRGGGGDRPTLGMGLRVVEVQTKHAGMEAWAYYGK